ncbi:MAG: CcoQ/FixQ family Cbb3-type cytochrome c oxidase assembly chaperone [Ignavibacteriae bacterium]|nr:CcoQ/FixQ family Cbb3-type cytochrome c oxidase assembly chaperone [Ignavibacteriota bacterium]
MFRDILNNVEGFGFLITFSLIFFFVLFILILFWVWKLDNGLADRMKNLPLEGDFTSITKDSI